ncbi:MAG: 50S ribosomal protein L4 [Candidatus Aenigmarchaeota archaeon]|nr:50S ribosomal protein L4 [Candidatus Aenigmarchaeota archaeon]
MKVDILDLEGKSQGKIELPEVFDEKFRPDIIKRAVLALQSQRRQPYGTDELAGLRTSAHYHGRRRTRWTMMMRDMARLPRIHGTSPHMTWRARKVPQAVKGRKAHPPKVEKVWYQKINKKEKNLALRSAIAATADREIVKKRGHRVDKIKELPLVVDDRIESIKKTKDLKKLLLTLGLENELKRLEKRKVRAGKGKIRGRKYKEKVGPLIVVSEDKGIAKACKNLIGVDVSGVNNLSVEDLAPGALAGRLTIWSKLSIEKLSG